MRAEGGGCSSEPATSSPMETHSCQQQLLLQGRCGGRPARLREKLNLERESARAARLGFPGPAVGKPGSPAATLPGSGRFPSQSPALCSHLGGQPRRDPRPGALLGPVAAFPAPAARPRTGSGLRASSLTQHAHEKPNTSEIPQNLSVTKQTPLQLSDPPETTLLVS